MKLKRRVKWVNLARELRAHGMFTYLSIPKLFLDFWRCLAFCYVPSARKPLAELDPDPLLSSEFPIAELEMLKKNPHTQTLDDCIAFAQEQQSEGLGQFMQFMARQGPKMGPQFVSWRRLIVGRNTQKSLRDAGLAIWSQAAQSDCVCPSVKNCSKVLTTWWPFMRRTVKGLLSF